ncbi:rsbT co-antagonist protein RsbR [Peribacillus deserti]|uniref:RsbT co-antagonist protein RsbR n=1 Tax=Peribacillus deserti TaxID=673318 RepID=A0ABS2QEB3_9BACI|nr:STAS domain-containing protein [Peribacillus deserti]MBM7691507.1 rsbT co-antagonist protein RsbR [Peribacillus deserti]
MHRNNDLYQFLMSKSWELTEDWYEQLDKNDPKGVYSSKDPIVIQTVKQQNHEFHERFFKVFNQDETTFFKGLEEWIFKIAQDEEHSGTPLQFIHREFFRTQDQYIDLINEFANLHKVEYSNSEVASWYQIVMKTFGKIIIWFTEEHTTYSQRKLQAQQELIMELSSPVIGLNSNVALLPLVGDVDTSRAKFMLENTLEQCSRLGVNQLFLDLSGVVMIDTMVAQQIFQLIEALSLIGVKTTLSGLRPEIAQTAVQLGLSFDKISIKSTLSSAISSSNFLMQKA